MRSCPSVGALDQGMVTWVPTRRPGRWSEGSSKSRKDVVPVAPMSERDACSLMVVADRKSSALSSLRGKPGTFIIPAYSTGAVPPTAWVMSAVMDWLGSVLRSVQESPPSSETKMGAVALSEPPGLGVKAEADRKSTRLNSSHSQISYAVFCLKKKTTRRERATLR